MNKKLILAIIVLGALVYVLSQGGEEVTSGIKGVVRLGPTCPVQKNEDDPNCADKMYQTKLELTRFNSVEVLKTFSSNKDGEFEVRVAPGEYTIRELGGGRDSKCGKSGIIPVETDQITEVIVFCDTGIR